MHDAPDAALLVNVIECCCDSYAAGLTGVSPGPLLHRGSSIANEEAVSYGSQASI